MSQYTAPTNLGQAPRALAAWLLSQDYTAHCRERIVSYAVACGTLTGCPELDPEDEATATEAWVEALPAVPQTDPAWSDGTEWTLPSPELEAIDAELFAAECDRRDAPDPWPTDEEIAEYEAEVERDRWLHVLEATRAFYRRHGSFGDWLDSQGGPA
jgi:hypothetical protein